MSSTLFGGDNARVLLRDTGAPAGRYLLHSGLGIYCNYFSSIADQFGHASAWEFSERVTCYETRLIAAP